MALWIPLVIGGSALVPHLKNAVALSRDDDAGIDSFNGRTAVWQDVGYYIHQHPVLGYGYGGFWTPTHIHIISDEEGWGIPESHSAYFDWVLTLGIVGLFGYVLLLLIGIGRAFYFQRLFQNPAFAFCGSLLVFCALIGFLESGAADPSLSMFLCMVVLTGLALVAQPKTLGVVNR